MEVEQVVQIKKELQEELFSVISQKIIVFNRDTGLNVTRINIDMVECREVGIPPTHMVGGVAVVVEV